VPTSPKEKFPKISKNVGSWKTQFFPNFTAAGKSHLLECDPGKGKCILMEMLDFSLEK